MTVYVPPTDVAAVQSGLTSIRVSWTPVDGSTGYMIFYNSTGGHSGNVIVEETTTSHTLTGLYNGQIYSLSVSSMSHDLLSIRVYANTVDLSKFTNNCVTEVIIIIIVLPPPTDVTAVQSGLTSIRVSWTPVDGSTGYMIFYNSTGGHSGNVIVEETTTSHTLTGLYNGQIYSLSVSSMLHDLRSIRVYANTVGLSKLLMIVSQKLSFSLQLTHLLLM